MSLVQNAMEKCVLLDKRKSSDGRGGFITTWEDGAEFMAAFAYDTSLTTQIANASTSIDKYRITTGRTVVLDFHDVFKRILNGKTYRITRDAEDDKTPLSAGLNYRGYLAEEYVLTGD